MLSDKEKKEFSDKLNKLKENHENLRKNLTAKNNNIDDNDAERFKPIGVVYEFISMVLVVSFAGYFIGKKTNTMPWTMIVFILTGFTYSFYRLYKSVTKINK
jgi:F0F1-type ATP synthase assembly protein I